MKQTDLKSSRYGSAPQTKEEFYRRLEGQVRIPIELSGQFWAYCYTQLTDVQQEQNGIYYFDRGEKYDADRLKAIFGMPLSDEVLGTDAPEAMNASIVNFQSKL